tara:strand:+ start:66 stop:182 length:117 start_codon:yes stop_codon:yes gene_type:complete
MRNFYSNILKDNNKNISKALRFLKKKVKEISTIGKKAK